MTDNLPEERLRHLLGYIGVVRDALRMQNWDIILHQTPHDLEDVYAHTWFSDNHATFNIEISGNFFEESPARITNCVVHELIHVQHRDIDILWRGCTQENPDTPTSQALSWNSDYIMFIERFVSWVTQKIVDGGTVPEFSRRKKYPPVEGCNLLGEHRQ